MPFDGDLDALVLSPRDTFRSLRHQAGVVAMWKRILIASAAAGVILAFAVWELMPQRQAKATKENFSLIKNTSMSRNELVALLGPPGDYRSGPTRTFMPKRFCISIMDPNMTFTPEDIEEETAVRDFWGSYQDAEVNAWQSDEGEILVKLADDHVVRAYFLQNERLNETYLENLQWRAERPFRRWIPWDW